MINKISLGYAREREREREREKERERIKDSSVHVEEF